LTTAGIALGWKENRSIRNKARKWVTDALDDIEKSMPFPLLRIDSENGSEFINHHLFNWCEKRKLTFTRSRRGNSNDGARAIPVGIDDGLQEAGFPRLLGTGSAGKYGVEGDDENLKGLPAGFIPLGSTDPMPSTPSAGTDEAAVQRFTESDQPAPVDMMRPPTPQSDADDLERHGTEQPDPVRDLPDMLQPNDSGQDQLDDRQRSTVPSSTLRSDEQPIGEVSKSPRRQWPEPDEKKESSGAAQADEAA